MLLTVALRVCIGFRVANFNEKPSGAAPDIIPLESNGKGRGGVGVVEGARARKHE